MARLISRATGPASNHVSLWALAPVAAMSLLGGLAACASNSPSASSGSTSGSGTGSSSGATTGSGTGSGTGSASGTGSHSGSTAMSGSSGTGAAPCSADGGALPFVVDSVFLPSGWMGDGPPRMASDAGPALPSAMEFNPKAYAFDTTDACTNTVGSRSTAGGNTNPKGRCYEIIYTPHPRLTGNGWVGNYWLYPGNGATMQLQNWGVTAGYPIPMSCAQRKYLAGDMDAGSMKISFWARGAQGGELVQFSSGVKDSFPKPDYANAIGPAPIYLTATWKQYTIDLTGQDWAGLTPGTAATGVIGAFGFGVGARLTSAIADGGGAKGNSGDGKNSDAGDLSPPACTGNNQTDPVGCLYAVQKVYIDDIEWQ
jgi:hypothetical protein